MARKPIWQFSMRTAIGLVLIAGPLAGVVGGTFGDGPREIVLMMAVVFCTSIVLGVASTFVAFLILSPLLVVERMVRRPARPIPTELTTRKRADGDDRLQEADSKPSEQSSADGAGRH